MHEFLSPLVQFKTKYYGSYPHWLSQKGTVCALCKPSNHVYMWSRPRDPYLPMGAVLCKQRAMDSIILTASCHQPAATSRVCWMAF